MLQLITLSILDGYSKSVAGELVINYTLFQILYEFKGVGA